MTTLQSSPARLEQPANRFFLPDGYRERSQGLTLDSNHGGAGYWTAERVANAARFQVHVYRLAAALIRKHRLGSLLDVGCGPGTKLKTIIAPVCKDIEGLDQPSGVEAARAQGIPGKFTAVDLEQPAIAPLRTFDVIICADVVEHLLNPDPMLSLIRGFSHVGTRVVLSTPERSRLRGRGCGSSEKPEHVREWARGEFVRFVESRGFRVTSSRLYPQDDAPEVRGLGAEALFRLGLRARSPLGCHAVVCGSTP